MNADIHDLAQAYVVGALTEEEAREFTAHLDTCGACRTEVDALYDVTAALSETVATDPPPQLRASVLAAIAQTPQEAAGAEPVASPAPAGLPHATAPAPAAHPDAEDSNVVSMRRRSWTTLASSLVAAAAVLAAIAFGGLWIQSRNDADQATTAANELTSLLSADDVRTVPGVSHSPDHTGAIVMSRSQGEAVFVASDLPDLPNDQVYEAWTINGSQAPKPAGTFTPQGAHALVSLPDTSLQADTMAITVEPAGGSDQPTSDAVVTFVMPPA